MSSDRELIFSTFKRLVNECRGLLAFEDEIRMVAGHTNVAIFIERVNEAEEVIENYDL